MFAVTVVKLGFERAPFEWGAFSHSCKSCCDGGGGSTWGWLSWLWVNTYPPWCNSRYVFLRNKQHNVRRVYVIREAFYYQSARYDRLGLDGVKKCSQYRPIMVTQFLPLTSVEEKLQVHITRHRRYPFQIANNDQQPKYCNADGPISYKFFWRRALVELYLFTHFVRSYS